MTTETKLTDEDWKKAKKHFDQVRQQYLDLEGKPGVNVTIALRTVFDGLAIRYNRGERSLMLYRAMMDVQ